MISDILYMIHNIYYIFYIQHLIGALTFEARLVCVCAMCLDFFSVARTPYLCSTLSHNSIDYTHLAHTYIHIVGYAYIYILSLYTYTHKHTQTYTYIYAWVSPRIIYTHSHTDSILLY